jgi:hypothetical protein
MKKVRLPVALAVVILASAVVWRVLHTHYVQRDTSFRSEQRTASPPPTPANYGQQLAPVRLDDGRAVKLLPILLDITLCARAFGSWVIGRKHVT